MRSRGCRFIGIGTGFGWGDLAVDPALAVLSDPTRAIPDTLAWGTSADALVAAEGVTLPIRGGSAAAELCCVKELPVEPC